MGKSQDASDGNNVFDSVDFKNFLHQNILRSDDFMNGVVGPNDLSLFQSNQSFVSSYLSKDWEKKSSVTKCFKGGSDQKYLKTFENLNINKPSSSSGNFFIQMDGKNMIPKSQDWIKLNTLGKHVEIPYSMGIFSSSASSKNQILGSRSISNSQPTRKDTNLSFETDMQEKKVGALSERNIGFVVKDNKKKRKRSPRKKIIPLNKKYLEPTDKDVLLGRGGKSNHHPGNLRYRAEIYRLQERYKKTDDKEEKTNISERLVLDVQKYGGNFLENDDNGWYIIDIIVARRKVSQALREDKDPEKRRAKRQRFLTKRARLEKNAPQK